MTTKIAFPSSLCALVSGFLMVAAPGAATAQSADRLAEADANGDGDITWQEMLDMRKSIFERLDRDENGVVDSADSPRFGPGKNRFDEAFTGLKGIDANGDGRITRSEMLNGQSPLFENGDANGDRVLNAAELAALREQAPRPR